MSPWTFPRDHRAWSSPGYSTGLDLTSQLDHRPALSPQNCSMISILRLATNPGPCLTGEQWNMPLTLPTVLSAPAPGPLCLKARTLQLPDTVMASAQEVSLVWIQLFGKVLYNIKLKFAALQCTFFILQDLNQEKWEKTQYWGRQIPAVHSCFLRYNCAFYWK